MLRIPWYEHVSTVETLEKTERERKFRKRHGHSRVHNAKIWLGIFDTQGVYGRQGDLKKNSEKPAQRPCVDSRKNRNKER